MELEEYKVEIVSDPKKADQLYSLLINLELDALELPPLPITAIKDFIDERRNTLWDITVDGEEMLHLVCDKEAASVLLKMVKDAGVEEFPLAPLPSNNLRAFVRKQRNNVAQLDIRRNNDVQVRVKPEKAKNKEKDAKKSAKKEEN